MVGVLVVIGGAMGLTALIVGSSKFKLKRVEAMKVACLNRGWEVLDSIDKGFICVDKDKITRFIYTR